MKVCRCVSASSARDRLRTGRGVTPGVVNCNPGGMTNPTNIRDTVAGRKRLVQLGDGWHRFLPRSKRDAYAKQSARVAEARTLRDRLAADPSATESKQRDARVAYLDEYGKLEAMSDELLQWRAENVEQVTEDVLQRRKTLAADALAALADLEAALQDGADEWRALALWRNDNPVKRDASPGRGATIPGGGSLANLQRGIQSLLPSKPIERVSQAEYRRRLEAGEDVSRTKIAHGALRP